MRIGELAKKAGVTVQSVRFYERRGLLKPPPRTASGYRNYHQADVDRIAFIKWCQPLGFTLKEVRELIPLHSALATEPAPHRARPAELQKLIRIALQKSADVQARITLMKQAGKQLRFAINKCKTPPDHFARPPTHPLATNSGLTLLARGRPLTRRQSIYSVTYW
jgi:DNA-binding transcriptional MerR regulator